MEISGDTSCGYFRWHRAIRDSCADRARTTRWRKSQYDGYRSDSPILNISARLPMMRISLRESVSLSLVWHSHTVMGFHPAARIARITRSSRLRLSVSFFLQNSSRDRGGLPRLHVWPCQKHPFTKIAILNLRRTTSGEPGSAETCLWTRRPLACSTARTASSGAVFFERTAPMLRERCFFVRLSICAVSISVSDRRAPLHGEV